MQRSDTLKQATTSTATPISGLPEVIRRWFSGRRGLIIAGIAIVIAGLALSWSWLSTIGIASIILSLAPCALMCGLGACMMMRGGSPSAKSDSPEQAKSVETASALPQSDEPVS